MSAPIFGQAGELVAAISLWDTVDRHDLNALLSRRSDLLAAAKAISERLGHVPNEISRTG